MKLIILIVAQVVLLALSPAWAHSNPVRSEPSSGASLAKSPNEIKIWFSEPIKAGLSTIEVRDSNGKQVDRGDLHADEKDQTLFHLTLSPKLAPGSYQVIWKVVAQDLHVSHGSYSFNVGR